jgi:hypothetical protein
MGKTYRRNKEDNNKTQRDKSFKKNKNLKSKIKRKIQDEGEE